MTDEEYFYDFIRRWQHYCYTRMRRRLRRFILEMDIEDGFIDLGGES